MNDEQHVLDRFARAMAKGQSRRHILGLLTAGLAGLGAAFSGSGTAEAATVDLKCTLTKTKSYCIPNTFKYKVCSTGKIAECPIDSTCKQYTDAQGYTVAYCKYIG